MTIYEPSFAEESASYKDFVDKFKTKKTTDDCYTPDIVFEAAKEWAVEEYELQGREIIRPFWPGGDYRSHDYPENCVVIDNPPFSIISKIVKFYNQYGIDYFLFAPHLTNFAIRDTNHVIVCASVIYENGASVATSFVTNLGEYLIATPPELFDAIYEANRQSQSKSKKKKNLTKYDWPKELCTAAGIGGLAKDGENFTVKSSQAHRVSTLDQSEVKGKGVFGGGFLLSRERSEAKERAKERAKENHRNRGESVDPIKIVLSKTEQQIVDYLSREDEE